MPPTIFRPMTGMRRSALLLWLLSLLLLSSLQLLLLGGWRLSVQESLFNIHAKLGHFFESFGSDEELPMAVSLFFLNPLQLLGCFDKDIANRKWVDWSETVLVFGFGFHWAPLKKCGKIFTLTLYTLRMH